MCIQTKGTDLESGPLAIYGLDGDDSHLPVLVGICRDKEGEGCLHTVKPYLDSREKAGLTVHGRYCADTLAASVVALACIRGLWDDWVKILFKDRSSEDKDAAKQKAFESRIVLDVLTAGQSLGGGSCGAGMTLSMISMIFGAKFRQDAAITGGITASGFITAIAGGASKADIAAKGRKKRLILPIESKKEVESDRQNRAGAVDGGRIGDSVVLTGVATIWDVLREIIETDLPGEY